MDSYEEDSLPISIIRQHCFCPRIPYFSMVLGITPPLQPWMKSGVTFHEKMAMLEKRRKLTNFGLKEDCRFENGFPIKSRRLGIHGICDGILISATGDVYPLEFKEVDVGFIKRGHRMQLIAYAMVLSEIYARPVNAAFLLFGLKGKVCRVDIDEAGKESCLRLISEIKKNLTDEVLPASPATEKQCCQCEFLNFCADRS
jgi:CRISPR-associated exonuclease Cas4